MTTISQPLVSNGYTLSTVPERLGWLTPTDPHLSLKKLHEIYAEQGYIWFKGILDRAEILAFRRHYFTQFQTCGLLAKGSDPVEGLYSGGPVDRACASQLLNEAVRWPAYEALCKTPRLWQFYTSFLEAEPHLLQRRLIRHNVPGEKNCTAAHYDLIYLRAGTNRLCSSWIPLGDCPPQMGGLVYLEGSDALGRKVEAEFSAKNAELPFAERISAYNKNMRKGGWISANLPEMAEKFNTRWLAANYEAGDMVMHSPYMLHAATVNNDAHGRIRLSTDIRFQRLKDQVDPRWNNDWSDTDGL